MSDIRWTRVQVVLTGVPIEYMDCDSAAFVAGDEVIVEFINQDWGQPKIIGFKENPSTCAGVYIFPGQAQLRYESESRTMRLSYNSNAWAWKNPFPRDYTYDGEDQFSRVGYAATGENGIGFTVGGRTLSDTENPKHFFNDLDVFDSVAESFSIGENYPEEIFDLTFNSLNNGKLVAHGGRNSWAHTGSNRTYKYTIASDVWNYQAAGAQSYNHASFVINSVLYIIGGNRGNLGGGGTAYYGADNFGFGISDYYTDFRGTYYATQTTEAYDDSLQTWSQKTTCPVANFVKVNGWNLEGKGLVGGGGHSYEYDEQITAGYETFYSCPGGGKYFDIDDALDECGQDWYKESLQVHWVHLDIGLKENNESYLYDNLTESWTQKTSNLNGDESQATSTANDETVALTFSGSSQTNWYDYKLSTDTWSDRGGFGVTVNDDPVWYSQRYNAAGAEV